MQLYDKTALCFATRFDVKRNGPVNCKRNIEIERDSKMEVMRTEGPLGPEVRISILESSSISLF